MNTKRNLLSNCPTHSMLAALLLGTLGCTATRLDRSGSSSSSNTQSSTLQAATPGAAVTWPTWSSITALSTATGQSATGLKASADATYLYFQITGTGMGAHYHLYLNTDNNAATGYQYSAFASSGADYFIEDGALYKNTTTTWSPTSVTATITTTKSATQTQVAIPRANLGTLASTITVGYEDINSSWGTVSVLPSNLPNPLPMASWNLSTPTVAVSISPTTASMVVSTTQQFTSTVTGSSNTSVTWTATGGSVSTSGLYTAPTAAGTYTVKATSVADTTKSASATVTVTATPVVSVSISPTTASTAVSTTKQFTATVTGSSNTSVTWTVTGGTVSASGLYTAPATAGTYTVKATSVADTSKSASATVTVTATSGSTIIVDKSGAGNYTKIQDAVNAATAGTTIQVNAGTYTEYVTFPNSGSPTGGNITLSGQPGAIISGNNVSVTSRQAMVTLAGQSYITVQGFEICNLKTTDKVNGDPTAVYVHNGSTNIQILNNNIHGFTCASDNGGGDGSAHGIWVYGDSATAISNITISGNQVHDTLTGWSENCTLDGNVTNFVISNNTFTNLNNIAIDIAGYWKVAPAGSPDYARNGVVSGNTLSNITTYGTNPAYLDSTGKPTYACTGLYIDGGSNVIVERNTIDKADLGIEAACENTGNATSYVWIRNNFISRCPLASISVGGYDVAANTGYSNYIYIYNNTTYQSNSWEMQVQYNAQNIVIKNNIFVALSGNPYVGNVANSTAPTLDTNIYYGSSTTVVGSFQAPATVAFTDAHPKFVNPSLVAPYSNLHIATGSPAINAGLAITGTDWQGNAAGGTTDIDSAARVQGTAVDIGADEVQ